MNDNFEKQYLELLQNSSNCNYKFEEQNIGGFDAMVCTIGYMKAYKSEDFSFPYDYGHYYLMDQKVKSANVALDLSYLISLIEKNGFILEKYVKGYWQKHVPHENNDFQDYMILKKK